MSSNLPDGPVVGLLEFTKSTTKEDIAVFRDLLETAKEYETVLQLHEGRLLIHDTGRDD